MYENIYVCIFMFVCSHDLHVSVHFSSVPVVINWHCVRQAKQLVSYTPEHGTERLTVYVPTSFKTIHEYFFRVYWLVTFAKLRWLINKTGLLDVRCR